MSNIGLSYFSGAGGMFLTEVLNTTCIDDSGNWRYNPGCSRELATNEYGGATQCFGVSKDSLPEAKRQKDKIFIFKGLIDLDLIPELEIDEMFIIDSRKANSLKFCAMLQFIKKHAFEWLNPELQDMYIQKVIFTSQPIVDLCNTNPILNKYGLVISTLIKKNMRITPESVKRIFETWESGNATGHIDYRAPLSNGPDFSKHIPMIEAHTKLSIIDYSDFFLQGKESGTIFDNYLPSVVKYTERNIELIREFWGCMGLNSYAEEFLSSTLIE